MQATLEAAAAASASSLLQDPAQTQQQHVSYAFREHCHALTCAAHMTVRDNQQLLSVSLHVTAVPVQYIGLSCFAGDHKFGLLSADWKTYCNLPDMGS